MTKCSCGSSLTNVAWARNVLEEPSEAGKTLRLVAPPREYQVIAVPARVLVLVLELELELVLMLVPVLELVLVLVLVLVLELVLELVLVE